MHTAQYVAVVGAKGGVGKTSLTINLGSALHSFGREVMIVDGNVSKPNLGLYLGFSNTPKSVHSAIAGDHLLKEAVYEHPTGLKIIPSNISLEYLKHAKHTTSLKNLLLELRSMAEIVLVDTSSGLGSETTDVMHYVDSILLVTTPDIVALTDCMKSAQLAQQHGVKVLGVVINKIKEHEFEQVSEHVSATLGHPVIGMIPYDKQIGEAQHHKHPVVYTHHSAKATIAYKKLAANLIGEEYEPDLEQKDGLLTYILQRTGLKD